MRKGQYALVEQVILFGLGISVALGFMYAFQGIGEDIEEDVRSHQVDVVSSYLAYASADLIESGSEGSISMEIPEKIASENYIVRFGEGGVELQMAGEKSISPLYGLESRIEPGGQVLSNVRFSEVTLRGDRLRIGRS
ncbi:MAG: hypothetical protein MUP63_04120 [Candidatus Nanohaloarchaeota archaeon QJJ-7]|nr:hypothetical protein [Candidatus Nanohaloarchaeota archaeon QJJ-7]